MARVVILGMGFGGVRAARALAGKGLDVLIIDRRNYHLFQPLLYQVATSSLEEESIAYPVRALIRGWKGVRFRLAEVTGVDFEKRLVRMSDGEVGYDYLIVAAGGATNFFGLQSVEQRAFQLKGLGHAVRLRNHILSVFEQADREDDPDRRRALMTFVIVGGGPTGVEFAGALEELIHHELSRDYPGLDMGERRILLLEAKDVLLPPVPKELQLYSKKRLEGMGVEVHLNTQVSGAEDGKVLLADGAVIPTYTIVWSAGVQASPLAAELGLPRAAGGRIPVQQDLSLVDRENVFIIGDMAFLLQDGRPLPMVASVAMQQGEYAAHAILDRIKGEKTTPFRYHDKGAMAIIGRNSAVAKVFGVKMTGFIAWVVWLTTHLMFLVGFRNRLLVLLNWAYYYYFSAQQVRLITDGNGNPPEAAAK
jgi:NADH:ubiquinone reductase (H+-translocating)